jgi:hypothetical protein
MSKARGSIGFLVLSGSVLPVVRSCPAELAVIDIRAMEVLRFDLRIMPVLPR